MMNKVGKEKEDHESDSKETAPTTSENGKTFATVHESSDKGYSGESNTEGSQFDVWSNDWGGQGFTFATVGQDNRGTDNEDIRGGANNESS